MFALGGELLLEWTSQWGWGRQCGCSSVEFREVRVYRGVMGTRWCFPPRLGEPTQVGMWVGKRPPKPWEPRLGTRRLRCSDQGGVLEAKRGVRGRG